MSKEKKSKQKKKRMEKWKNNNKIKSYFLMSVWRSSWKNVVLWSEDHDSKKFIVAWIGSSTKEPHIVIIIMNLFDGNSWTLIKFKVSKYVVRVITR
jgi:hypothetical protein